jgi:hypothetical protein
MVYTSLAILALAASALLPIPSPVHLHPQVDTRVRVTLVNNSIGFRDVRVDGHVYTVQQHHSLVVTAPAGTVVYAVTPTVTLHRGDAIVEITPQLDKQKIGID